MTNVQKAQKISADITRWVGLSSADRAFQVLEWCMRNDVDSGSVLANELAAAMGQQKYWCQGPDDYLDMVMSITAALRARR